jgi:hypothetical protein
MKKIIPVMIGILVVIGLITLKVAQKPVVSPKEQAQVVTVATTSAGIAQSRLEEVFKEGKDVTCSYSGTSSSSPKKGVIFVSGTKYRGDFESQVKDKSGMVHMIGDGVWYYIWVDGATQALKINVSESQDMGATAAAARILSSYTSPEIANQLTCFDWKYDSKTFVPPTEYYFVDMTEKLKNLRLNESR